MKKFFRLYLPLTSLSLLLGIMVVVVHIGGEIQYTAHLYHTNVKEWTYSREKAMNGLKDYLHHHTQTDFVRFQSNYLKLRTFVEVSRALLNQEVSSDSVARLMARERNIELAEAQDMIFYLRLMHDFTAVQKSINAWDRMSRQTAVMDDLAYRIRDHVQNSSDDASEHRHLSTMLDSYEQSSIKLEANLMDGLHHSIRWLDKFIRQFSWGLSIFLFLSGGGLIFFIYYRSSYHEEKFHQLFTNAEMAIVFMDTESNVLEVNEAFTSTFGYRLKDIRNKNIDHFLVPPDKFDEAKQLNRRSINGQYVTKTTWRTDKNGHRIDVIVSAVPVQIDDKIIGIFGLYYDITKLVNTTRKLESSLEEKKLLIQEIHHRVKNNLTVIASLLELHIESTDDEKTRYILRESQMRIYSMSMIHELLYQSKTFTRIPIHRYLERFINHLRSNRLDKTNIDLEYTSDPFELNINQAVPCGMIINELVNYTIAESFGDENRGVIQIDLSKSGNHITLSVTNNGYRQYTRREQESSIELNIVRNLVYQLEGSIEFHESVNEEVGKGNSNTPSPIESGSKVTVQFEQQETKGAQSGMLEF